MTGCKPLPSSLYLHPPPGFTFVCTSAPTSLPIVTISQRLRFGIPILSDTHLKLNFPFFQTLSSLHFPISVNVDFILPSLKT